MCSSKDTYFSNPLPQELSSVQTWVYLLRTTPNEVLYGLMSQIGIPLNLTDENDESIWWEWLKYQKNKFSFVYLNGPTKTDDILEINYAEKLTCYLYQNKELNLTYHSNGIPDLLLLQVALDKKWSLLLEQLAKDEPFLFLNYCSSHESPVNEHDLTQGSKIPWIHYLITRNEVKIIKILLEKGLNVHLLDKQKRSLLFYAQSVDMINVLLEFNADLTLRDKNQKNVLEYCTVQNKSKPVIELLQRLTAPLTKTPDSSHQLILEKFTHGLFLAIREHKLGEYAYYDSPKTTREKIKKHIYPLLSTVNWNIISKEKYILTLGNYKKEVHFLDYLAGRIFSENTHGLSSYLIFTPREPNISRYIIEVVYLFEELFAYQTNMPDLPHSGFLTQALVQHELVWAFSHSEHFSHILKYNPFIDTTPSTLSQFFEKAQYWHFLFNKNALSKEAYKTTLQNFFQTLSYQNWADFWHNPLIETLFLNQSPLNRLVLIEWVNHYSGLLENLDNLSLIQIKGLKKAAIDTYLHTLGVNIPPSEIHFTHNIHNLKNSKTSYDFLIERLLGLKEWPFDKTDKPLLKNEYLKVTPLGKQIQQSIEKAILLDKLPKTENKKEKKRL